MSTTTNNGQANNQLMKVDVLKKVMDAPSVQEQFKNALAENAPSFVASVIDLYNSDSYLQNCEPKQVVMEALKAAVLKLPIVKSLGFAYIVPYKSGEKLIPQFQIGYKGLIQLAMRTGQYRIINADVVYEGEYKSKNKLTGEFDLNGEAISENIIGFFAHFEMLNGFSKTLYMTKERVTQHARKYSKSFNVKNGPWEKEFDAMAIKTVLRGLLGHWGFLSVEMIQVMNDDEGDDASNRVQSEINNKANRQSISLEGVQEAELVNEGQNTGGPGF